MSLMKNISTDHRTNSPLEDNVKDVTEEQTHEFISNEMTLYVMRVLMYGVTPVISALGVIGNIFSIIILLKHGLHKCSNILLICLAVTDLTFLIAFNSVPKIIYEVVRTEFAFDYDRDTSYALYILYNVFNVLDYAMGYFSLTMPMFITFERLIAVYFPFKFNLIITPTRTWCALAINYLFWYTDVIYMSFWGKFVYTFSETHNMTVGLMDRSDLYYNHLDSVHAVQSLNSYMSMKIPPVFTFVGCVFISVKVKMASARRKKMTQASSKEASSNRTTKMLLAVCVIYMIACAVLSLPTYIPQHTYYSIATDAPSNVGRIMYQVMNIAVCINSSANFVVYVVMNKNFRDTYKSLFVCQPKQYSRSCGP